MPDDPVAAELAPVRERSAAFRDPAVMDLYRTGCAHKSAEDVPRLLAALDAVLAPHAPRTDLKHGRSCAGHRLDGFAPRPGCGLCTQDEHRQVCPECRDSFGDPVPFAECRARARALGALKGEGADGGSH